jgi:D-aminopeptidase
MPQSGPPPARARARELGIDIGEWPTGPGNAITDVPGVLVGHATVWREEPDPPAGRGVARTGVTAVVPGPPVAVMADALPAGVAVLNGAGELTSAIEVRELGWLQTPIVLTSTMQVGRAWDGLIEVLCELDPTLGLDDVVIPMVGECDDSWLNDARRTQISVDDVRAAVLGAAPGPVAEGAVGAGTGMICFGWKGGIGTASRQLETGHTVGILLLTNFGSAEHLTVAGVPVGRTLRPPPWTEEHTDDAGSCIGIVATDAPCAPDDLERVARRIGLGLAKGGSVAFSGSGEIFVAFSTVPFGREAVLRHRQLNPLFAAVVEAAEEALLNSLTTADTVTGAHDHTIAGLPIEETQALLRASGRLRS